MRKEFVAFLFLGVLLSGCVQPPGPPGPPEPPVQQEVEIFFQPMQCIVPPWGSDDSEQTIKDFYATADIEIYRVEKIESGDAVCDACYECVQPYYFRAVVLEENFDRIVSFGWLKSLPEPSTVALSYTVTEVIDDDFNYLDPEYYDSETLSLAPFKSVSRKDSDDFVLNKRIISACFQEIVVLGKEVSETGYELSFYFPPGLFEEELCLFDVEVVFHDIPEEIKFVKVLHEGKKEVVRVGDIATNTAAKIFFQPMQCEDFPWGKSTVSLVIENFYLEEHLVSVFRVRRNESNLGVCNACYECPASFFFEARVFKVDKEKMVSLGWQAEPPIG